MITGVVTIHHGHPMEFPVGISPCFVAFSVSLWSSVGFAFTH